MTGFMVSKHSWSTIFFSSSVSATGQARIPLKRASFILCNAAASNSSCALTCGSLTLSFLSLSNLFSILAMSVNANSKLMTSMSDAGSTLSLTWTISLSSKHRTTCTIESTSQMCDRNLFPRPSPSLAPLTSPAKSTN
ncbi:hypothetical protein Mapa_000274 [Marchantia paleacea]|nr:hypothetical protein Mapa_000274 [Marchantia paleacea]